MLSKMLDILPRCHPAQEGEKKRKVKEFSEKVKADREAIRERAINERADHQFEFYQKNGRFPNARKEKSEWHQLHFMIKKYPDNPKVKVLAEMYDTRYK